MHTYYYEGGTFQDTFEGGCIKDVEVKLSMKVFLKCDGSQTSYEEYEEKEQHVKNLVKCITRDKDIIEVFNIKVLDIFEG